VGTSPITTSFISGSLKQFVGAYRHSDLVILTALSDVVDLSLRDLSRDLAAQMDSHIRDQLSGSSGGRNVFAAGKPSGSVLTTDRLRTSDLLKSAAILDKQNNPRPPGGCYPGIIDPQVQFDLASQLTGNSWFETNKYKGYEEPEHLYRGELGRSFGVALVTSTNIKRITGARGVSAGNSGFTNLILAPEARSSGLDAVGIVAEVVEHTPVPV